MHADFAGLPFLEMSLVNQADFDLLVEKFFGTDRQSVPKGMVERYEANKREQGGDEHMRELTMRSLKRLINQLKEESARFESRSSLRTNGE